MALQEPVLLFRGGEPVFTPFAGDAIDEQAVQQLIEGWLAEAKVAPQALFSGGVIITGGWPLSATMLKHWRS